MSPELVDFVKSDDFRRHYVLISQEYVPFLEEVLSQLSSRNRPNLRKGGELMRTYITTTVKNGPLNFKGLEESFPDLAKLSFSQSVVKRRKTPKNKRRISTKKKVKH